MTAEHLSSSSAQPNEGPTPEQKRQVELAKQKAALLLARLMTAFNSIDQRVWFAQDLLAAVQATQLNQKSQPETSPTQ